MGFCLSWQRRFAEAERLKRPVKPANMCDVCGFVTDTPIALIGHKRSHGIKPAPKAVSYDYAVYKGKSSRAWRVFDEEKAAEDFIAEQEKPQLYRIVPRKRK